MKYLYEPAVKTKIVIVLFVVIAVVMINNLAKRRDFADLDRAMSSIYQDRLMPAGYLFNLNNLLHEKYNALQGNDAKKAADQIRVTDKAIAHIFRQYENTYLTNAEKEQWRSFKTQLAVYNKAEQGLLSLMPSTLSNNATLHQYFADAQASLTRLNALQVKEGNLLQQRSKSIIGGSVINTYLDTSLLFVLGIIALAAAGFKSRSSAITGAGNALLN